MCWPACKMANFHLWQAPQLMVFGSKLDHLAISAKFACCQQILLFGDRTSASFATVFARQPISKFCFFDLFFQINNFSLIYGQIDQNNSANIAYLYQFLSKSITICQSIAKFIKTTNIFNRQFGKQLF